MPDPAHSDSRHTDAPPTLRVSVVLLAYNQAEALRRALSALEASKARESFEIIVVDCASSDGTRELDTEFPSINMLRLPHHIGAGRAYNIAARTAKGGALLFLSPNVEVQPDTVAVLTDALDREPEAAAVCPALTGTAHVFRMPDPAKVAQVPAEPGEFVEYPTLDALMVKKAFVVAMNYFDKRYGHYWVDAELAMQIRRAGKKIRYCPAAPAAYHPSADPLAGDGAAAADKVVGAAEFAGKYGGGAFGMRVGAALGALGHFDFKSFGAILSGQKLDGSQV